MAENSAFITIALTHVSLKCEVRSRKSEIWHLKSEVWSSKSEVRSLMSADTSRFPYKTDGRNLGYNQPKMVVVKLSELLSFLHLFSFYIKLY